MVSTPRLGSELAGYKVVDLAGRRSDVTAPLELGQRRSDLALALAERIADGGAAFFAILAGYLAYHWMAIGRNLVYQWQDVLLCASGMAVIFVMMLDREGVYRPGKSLLQIRETERLLRASCETLLLFTPALFLSGQMVSRWVAGISFISLVVATFTEKQLFLMAIRKLHVRGIGTRRVLIYGAGPIGRRLYSALVRSPKLGLTPAVMVDEGCTPGEKIYSNAYHHEDFICIDPRPLGRRLFRSAKIDIVMIAHPTIADDRLAWVIREASLVGAQVAFVPKHVMDSNSWIEYADIDGTMIAYCSRQPKRRLYSGVKRIVDLAVGVSVFILVAPAMAAIAALIRLDSPGPAFFRQKRVGENGKEFDMWKFRTMRLDSPIYADSPSEHEDPRITRAGRFLRKSSLDELPQILNVLRGEMSLVGPRPEMPFIVEKYTDFHRQRLTVKPGMTGLWQLSADRAFHIHENIEYDLYYIRNRSLFMDLAILFHTVLFAARGI